VIIKSDIKVARKSFNLPTLNLSSGYTILLIINILVLSLYYLLLNFEPHNIIFGALLLGLTHLSTIAFLLLKFSEWMTS